MAKPLIIYIFVHAILHHGFFTSHLLLPFSFRTFISLFSLDFYFPFLLGLLFPFSIWTFICLFYLDFYFPILFGLLFFLNSFSICFQFVFNLFSICFQFVFNSFLIHFQVFCFYFIKWLNLIYDAAKLKT